VHAADDEHALAGRLVRIAARRGGRVLGGGVPTGVAVGWAQHHGGPWPATTQSAHTSVGAASIRRFLRPVVYQDVPHHLLPAELHDHNPLGLVRRIDARLSTDAFV
jgi:NADP-dependent aldehyde dehydrogenase